MPTIYGFPAIEVEAPNGDPVLYLIRAVPAAEFPDGSRGWVLTSPEGKAYRVSLSAAGTDPTCTCPHFAHRGVRCKHIVGVLRREGLEFMGQALPAASSPR